MNTEDMQRLKDYATTALHKHNGRPLLPAEAAEVLWGAVLLLDPTFGHPEKCAEDVFKNVFMLGFSCGWELHKGVKSNNQIPS